MNVGAEVYSKISHKPRTQGRVCVAHICLYDLLGHCFYISPAVWSGCPDKTIAKRYVSEIEAVLQVYKNQQGYQAFGAFDGGFYHRELLQRLGWVTPLPTPVVEQTSTSKRAKYEAVNTFISTVRGPWAEGKFSEQVGKFKVLTTPWRFDLRLHDIVLRLIEALLNINRRIDLEEDVGITYDAAMESAFLYWEATRFDDLLRRKEPGHEEPIDVYEFHDDDEVPVALSALFPNHDGYQVWLSVRATERPAENHVRSTNKRLLAARHLQTKERRND